MIHIDIKRCFFAILSSIAILFGTINPAGAEGFMHGIVVELDGDEYYLAGASDGPNGEEDIPGHYWIETGKGLLGKHYNTGPFEAPSWWSSDAGDGDLLYIVKGTIDTWTEEKAVDYASRGFMHYHEFVRVSDGAHHPMKVIWLRHIAVTSFNLDGGPRPDLGHEVSPGIDYEFIPNWSVPYEP
jgi:hypothetical protein